MRARVVRVQNAVSTGGISQYSLLLLAFAFFRSMDIFFPYFLHFSLFGLIAEYLTLILKSIYISDAKKKNSF